MYSTLFPREKNLEYLPRTFPPSKFGKTGGFYFCHIFVHILRSTVGSFSVNSKIYFLDLWKGNFKSFSTMYSTLPPEVFVLKFLSQTFSHQNKERRKKTHRFYFFIFLFTLFKKSQVGSTVILSFIF